MSILLPWVITVTYTAHIMSQVHTRRESVHPLIETVWATRNVSDGIYQATPDGSWDLIVLIQADGSKSMMLTGQATKPMDVAYQAGTSSVVISFMPGAYMPAYPSDKLVDSFELLPNADTEHFLLSNHTFAFPTFDDAEGLVEAMIAANLLFADPVVYAALTGSPKAMSERSTQRHFVQSTGITQKYLTQIQRAQEAVRQLQQGKKPSDVAADTGYADQPHLARSLKKIMAAKPSSVDDIHKL
jgi:AraC-like DNA-binding protein